MKNLRRCAMKRVLALVLVGLLAFSSLSMAATVSNSSALSSSCVSTPASQLNSADTSFLFNDTHTAATTMCDQEMAATQGQLLDLLGGLLGGLLGSDLLGGLLGSVLSIVFGLLGGLLGGGLLG